jgi:hypothetical protein
MPPTGLTRADAEALDAADELAAARGDFLLPEGVVYLDGNSLGALPRRAVERLHDVVEREWGRDLIRSWNDNGWIDLPSRVAGLIAPLIGASADEVAVADSTSVNVFKLLAGGMRLRPGRHVIVSEEANFPTDLYVAQGLARLLGDVELRLVPRDGLRASLGADVAVLLLTHVDFRTGEIHDVAGLTRAAHDAGALVLWDLAHSAGAVPVDLDGADADLAVGLRLQVLERRPGRARLRVRGPTVALGVRESAVRLDGARGPLRLWHPLRAGPGRLAPPLRHAADPQPRRPRVRRRGNRPRRDRAPAPQVGGATDLRAPRRAECGAYGFTPRAARPSGAAARSATRTPRGTRSSRR